MHDGFDFWVEDVEADGSELAATLDRRNASVNPTARLASVDAAYWTDVGPKEHLRWVLPHAGGQAARRAGPAARGGRDHLVPDGRLVGMFRAHGLLTPVWDLPVGTGAEALEEPAARLADELADALADPRTADHRRAGRPITGSPTARSRSADAIPGVAQTTSAPPLCPLTGRGRFPFARSLLCPPSATAGSPHL